MNNHAPFRTEPVAESLIAFFERQKGGVFFRASSEGIVVQGPADLYRFASEEFLLTLLTVAVRHRSQAASAVLMCCLGEAYRRKKLVKSPELYHNVIEQFGTPGIPVEVYYEDVRVSFYLGDAFLIN
jgi:hypothetical protein